MIVSIKSYTEGHREGAAFRRKDTKKICVICAICGFSFGRKEELEYLRQSFNPGIFVMNRSLVYKKLEIWPFTEAIGQQRITSSLGFRQAIVPLTR